MDRRSWFGIWVQWVIANAIGEVFGLGPVAIAGYVLGGHAEEAGNPEAIAGVAVVLVVLGAFEGAVVGLAQ